jgi:hypothetical protein
MRGGQFSGLAEGDEAGDVFGSPAASFILVAATEERRKLGAPFDIKRAGTFEAMQFVGAERAEIDVQRGDIQGNFAGGLYRIRVKQYALLLADLAGFFDREKRAGFVICHHDGDDGGFRRNDRSQVGECQAAIGVDRQVRNPYAFGRELLAQSEDAGVLYLGGDNVAFSGGGQGAANGGVVAFRAAAGAAVALKRENDIDRVGGLL